MANIYEVARRAGVSTATVSRVLSQPNMVSPDTRRKVMQAVELLDYEPNSAAKNLRTLRTGKLGCTTRTYGPSASFITGAKSLIGS